MIMKDENIPTTGRDGHLCRDGHGFFERTKFFVKKGCRSGKNERCMNEIDSSEK